MGTGASGGSGQRGRRLAQAGLLACSLLVFLCGYYAMRTDDWTRIIGFTLLALVSGILASAFARRARGG